MKSSKLSIAQRVARSERIESKRMRAQMEAGSIWRSRQMGTMTEESRKQFNWLYINEHGDLDKRY